MKAISIRQPWAWFLASGIKPVENRSWHTNHRGPVLVHASKAFDMAGYDWILENHARLNIAGRIPFPDEYDKGALIGRANLVRTCRNHVSPWFFGPWGFVFITAELFSRPVVYPGKLGFFEVNDVDIEQNFMAPPAGPGGQVREGIPQIQKLLF